MVPLSEQINGFWPILLTAMEGRFAVLFIVLAGIGVSLMTKRARQNPALMRGKKKTLRSRAVFLFFAGLIFSMIWQADILHYYGVYILLALLFIEGSDKRLISLIPGTTLGFVLLFLFFDWEAGWNFKELHYTNLWSLAGFIKNTFFNGFHPFFPWFAFFIFGMFLGRIPLETKQIQKRYLPASLLVFIICEVAALGLTFLAGDNELSILFSTLSFPPFPLFVISGCANALFLILLCLIITQKFPGPWLRPIIATGQMVLSHYIFHVIIGMAFLEAVGRLTNQSLGFCLLFTLAYFSLSVLFSSLWKRRFQKGPMEAMMRKICG